MNGEGERTYKLSGMTHVMNINGQPQTYDILDRATLYVSPYLVASERGASKHIYAGTERIASHPVNSAINGLNSDGMSEEEIMAKQNAQAEMMYDIYSDYLPGEGSYMNISWDMLAHLRSTSRNMPKDEIYYYHTDHLSSSSWITYTDGIPVQYLSYMPFGESQMDQRSADWSSRYTFSGKERDEETGYSYFGARYYDPDISIWLSRDPLADKYPYQSPYVYCGNNPLRIVDPNGEDEWEFDQVAGKFNKIGDKGGSETDHYNIGQRNEKGEFTSDQTVSIDRNGKSNINSFRMSETENSTTSAFHIPDADISGYFLEPSGPSTEQSGQDKRIPEGEYNIESYSSKKYSNVFILSNDKVSKNRKILIHTGNTGDHTEGCLLPGVTQSKGGVWDSKTKMNQLRSYINLKKPENVRLNIFNIIKK